LFFFRKSHYTLEVGMSQTFTWPLSTREIVMNTLCSCVLSLSRMSLVYILVSLPFWQQTIE